MSQQLQQPPTQQPAQQSTQHGAGVGKQSVGATGGGQQSFQQSASREIQEAVTSLDRFETVSEWAKAKALQRGIPQVAKHLDDLTEIANLQKKLFLRESPYAEAVSQATTRSIQQSVQDLQAFAGEIGVQDVISEAQYATDTIGQASVQAQQWSQQVQQGLAGGQQGMAGGQQGMAGGQQGTAGGVTGQQGMVGGGAAAQQPEVGTGSQFQQPLQQYGGVGGQTTQGVAGQQTGIGQGKAGAFSQETAGLGTQQY